MAAASAPFFAPGSAGDGWPRRPSNRTDLVGPVPWFAPIFCGRATTSRDRLPPVPAEEGHEAPKTPGPGPGEVLAGECTAGQRLVGDECHAQLAAGVQDAVGLRLAMQQRVLHLIRRQRDTSLGQRCVGDPHLLGRVVAHAHRVDLPASTASAISPISRGMSTPGREVVLIQVDCVAAEPGQARRQRGRHVLGGRRIPGGNLVAISAGVPRASSPSRRSEAPLLYMAAVSNNVTPAARLASKARASCSAPRPRRRPAWPGDAAQSRRIAPGHRAHPQPRHLQLAIVPVAGYHSSATLLVAAVGVTGARTVPLPASTPRRQAC